MTCRICGAEGEHTTYVAREMMHGIRDEHAYFQCGDCGCLQIKEFPADMGKYYAPSSYYAFKPAQLRATAKRWIIRQRDHFALFGSGAIGRIAAQKFPTDQFEFSRPIRSAFHPDARILDVGCGAGLLLQSLRALGFRRLLGIDPFIAEDIRHDQGLTIQKRFVHEVEGEFDMVMFHHSFEHVPDPLATLRSAFERLAPGGFCIVRIPLADCWAWEHYGVDWVQLDAPRHFFLHTCRSFAQLAAQCGFLAPEVAYDSTAFQFWGSEQYRMDVPLMDGRSCAVNPRHPLFTNGAIADFTDRARSLNVAQRGDQATFYLRRPSVTVA